MKRGVTIPVGLVIAVLIGLYVSGHFDRPLYSIGLNYHECARNGLGATFCGTELAEYRERISDAKSESEAAASKINTLQHESEEQEQRSQEELRRDQESLERSAP